jgi:hypothetical protein
MATSPVWNNVVLCDQNGNPLSNGFIYCYAGDSWTVELQEPVQLNAQGIAVNFQIPANVYCNLKLTDQYGNFQRVVDPVVGIPAPPEPWGLSFEYDGGGGGNGNGGTYQAIVSDDAGVYSIAYGSYGFDGTASSSNGGNTYALYTNLPTGFVSGIMFNGTYFVALISGMIYFSTDLVSWTTDGVNYGVYQIFRDPGTEAIYFAPYGGTPPNTTLYRIAPNSNTVTLIINNAPGPNLATYVTSILTHGGITVSTYGSYPTYSAWWSADGGVTWTESATDLSGNDWFGLGYANGIWMLVAGAFVPPYPTNVWTSTDGKSWTEVDSTPTSPPEQNAIYTFNNLFMQFQGTNLYTSPDGITWTTTALPVYGFGFTPGPTRGYLYGPSGIYETTDGINYTATSITDYTNDVYVGGDTLAVTSTYGGAPVFIYKRS